MQQGKVFRPEKCIRRENWERVWLLYYPLLPAPVEYISGAGDMPCISLMLWPTTDIQRR
jgi:hypothetical protein